jgi:LPS sulfotransferase NodH
MKLTTGGVDGAARAVRSFGFRLLSAVGHADFTKFIVLSRSRTGSNLLLSLLNSHPEIIAEHEILAELDGRDARKVVAKAYGKQPYYVKAKGFKVFYYHPLGGEAPEVWDDLVAAQDIKVIHLKRRNILRTLVSRKIAGMKDVWAATSEARLDIGRQKTVSFRTEELEEGFRRTRGWETEGDRRFAAHPLLSVWYEDLVRDPEATLAQVLDFLGLRQVPLATQLRKQNPERLPELVSNYAELKAAFTGSEWAVFFEE